MSLPEFTQPPLNEMVFGLQFETLDKLRAAHFGKYWQRLEGRYPYTEEHLPIAHLVETPEPSAALKGIDVEFGMAPLVPRCWFLDEPKSQLLQVQNDRFLRNWRRLEGDRPYPRFSALVERFTEEWTSFRKFVEEEKIGLPVVDQCELTYINHIPKGDGWADAAELSGVVKLWPKQGDFEFATTPEFMGWKVAYRLPNNCGRLHVQLKLGMRAVDRAQLVILDLTARGISENRDGTGIRQWFDMAHEWIVRTFVDLTTDAMHKRWGRTR